MNTQKIVPSSTTEDIPVTQRYPKDQIPTEADLEEYYRYDCDLIQTILHNGSMAGLRCRDPRVTYSDKYDEVTISRGTNEELALFADPRDKTLMISVWDPGTEDATHEATFVYLSRREIHVLRTLLNRMAW